MNEQQQQQEVILLLWQHLIYLNVKLFEMIYAYKLK